MTSLIDTDIAIHVRDGDRSITRRLASLGEPPALSLITLVELQGGFGADADVADRRRRRVGELLQEVIVLELDRPIVDLYGAWIQRLGFSRPRILDRLIAATAAFHDLTLITINGSHFRDVPDLKLEVWPAPGQ